MKIVVCVAVFAGCLALGFAQSRGASDPDEAAVRAVEAKMMMAAMHADAKTFESLCDRDYRSVNEDGSFADLKDVMLEMKMNPLKPGKTPPEFSEPLVRIVGDSAFVSGRWKMDGPDGKPLDLRYLEVWTKRSGDWKFVQWQATRVTPEGLAREKIYKNIE
jgi:ketosteroid isomerase-like protein